MSNSIVAQIPKNLLFRYRLNCHQFKKKVTKKFDLDESFQLPGFLITVAVTTKKQALWCRHSELLDSDGLQFWIDTRDTHNVHRATKFCHWFTVLPASGPKDNKPLVSMLKINRSRADSPTINRSPVQATSEIKKNGYVLRVFVPGETLNGWDANEHRHLGFNYAIIDRELGQQTLAIGPQLPIQEDPSLWQSLHLK